MGQVSGKGSGYYGCLGAVKRACSNKIIVPRRLAERRVLAALRERISDVVSLQYVLGRVEMEVKRLHAHLPQEIKDKRGALVIEERRIANFIAFIGDGKGTRALASALSEAEARADTLRAELATLAAAAEGLFQPPSVEWVIQRVAALDDALQMDTTRSALVLRRALGPVYLHPVTPEVGRPYYRAETAVQILELLQDPDDGSNSLRQWRRGESNRTGGDEEGEDGRDVAPLAMSSLPTSPEASRHLVPPLPVLGGVHHDYRLAA